MIIGVWSTCPSEERLGELALAWGRGGLWGPSISLPTPMRRLWRSQNQAPHSDGYMVGQETIAIN